ncbi:hypothetical protein DIE14_17230 [Burkholderia sp. Bp9017]|nr:hypothetical protein DIE14_17230 [Burkholderia sp. Bp9017]RQZ33352.1 hypothetical protein DIE13_17140 [Burkholderia sp. Bp9016]
MEGGPRDAAPARANREADGRTLPAGGALRRRRLAATCGSVQVSNRRCDAVTGSGWRASVGQEGATRVTRRRAAGSWLP